MSNVNTALVIGGGIAGPVAAAACQSRDRCQRLRGISGTERRHRRCLALAPNGLAALGDRSAPPGGPRRARRSPAPSSRSAAAASGHARRCPGCRRVQMIEPRRPAPHAVRARRAAGVQHSSTAAVWWADDGPDGVTARFADGTHRHRRHSDRSRRRPLDRASADRPGRARRPATRACSVSERRV